eukprot:CAMPEP_0180288318 /NCGR_PEP_ID=MMETSP0988-20121125/13981_1 /TAXON_ID=697907 /ORGANISM="non described non described, Strain CCMP2293" /LENGTH=153 /DNA_ID=CAMNT_0022262981 /DNA_START=170 /DNA_END=628 /DNA_ORIENTATION=-
MCSGSASAWCMCSGSASARCSPTTQRSHTSPREAAVLDGGAELESEAAHGIIRTNARVFRSEGRQSSGEEGHGADPEARESGVWEEGSGVGGETSLRWDAGGAPLARDPSRPCGSAGLDLPASVAGPGIRAWSGPAAPLHQTWTPRPGAGCTA